MKAAVLERYGSFRIIEKDIPKPAEGEVLVKVTHASICGSDQHIFSGDFHPRTKLPFVPGHEFIGIIEEAGKGVEEFMKGCRVCVDPIIPCENCEACKRKHFPACTSLKLLGIDMDGGFQEYLAVSQ